MSCLATNEQHVNEYSEQCNHRAIIILHQTKSHLFRIISWTSPKFDSVAALWHHKWLINHTAGPSAVEQSTDKSLNPFGGDLHTNNKSHTWVFVGNGMSGWGVVYWRGGVVWWFVLWWWWGTGLGFPAVLGEVMGLGFCVLGFFPHVGFLFCFKLRLPTLVFEALYFLQKHLWKAYNWPRTLAQLAKRPKKATYCVNKKRLKILRFWPQLQRPGNFSF